MVWARFLSTYNNRKMKTVLIELSIIRYSPHPFFYVYCVPSRTIHGLLYMSHCPHEAHDIYCAFHKHANSKVQKPPSQLRFWLPSIIITITSNEP